MADKKISPLPAAGALTSADVLPLVQGSATAKVSLTQLDSRWVSTSSGGSVTGGLTVSQYVAVGTNPATAGALRLPNNGPIYARDSANGANLNILNLGGTDWVSIGSYGSPYLAFQAKDGIQFNLNSVNQMTLTANNLNFKDSFFIGAGSTVGLRIGGATTQKLGFYGATPVVRPTGTPVAATDPATTMALVNSLRSALIALGLIS